MRHLPAVTVIGLVLALFVSAGSLRAADEAAAKPNVLFLFADDQRADALGALGNSVLKTPNLDRLVARGVVMQNAYCLGSNSPAVCTPSRNMLMSGRAYFRWKGPLAPAEAPNFPDAMKTAGYETYHHGKRGNVATAIQKRFDHNKNVNDEYDRTNGEPCRDIVDAAIDFLTQRSPTSKPFCMYLAFSNPHDPRVAADSYRKLYEEADLPLPANYLPVHPFNNGEMEIRDEKLAPWPRTPQVVRKHLHDYYAVISAMDLHVGRLLAKLDELRLAEKTFVIYAAEHGLALGSHGLMGKQSLYEHSMKVPLIVSGPAIRPGRSAALVYLMDIFPTVCELVGAPVPPGLDGRSFAGAVLGKPFEPRDMLFFAYRDVQRALRDERWKLIRYPEVNVTQLFDLASDPDEKTNLASDSAQAERVAAMLAQIARWQKHYGDETPLTVANPKPAAWTPPGN